MIHTKRRKLDSEYLPLIREFCENNDAILNKTWSEKCINIVQEKLNDKQDVYHVKNAMMQVMEKAAQKARQEHKCFLCKRSFDYNEETNFLKMLNEVNKDDSLEIVISDLKAKVKCIEQYHFSLVNDILPKEEMYGGKKKKKKMLHDRLSKAINEKAKTLKTEEDSRNDALKAREHKKTSRPSAKILRATEKV